MEYNIQSPTFCDSCSKAYTAVSFSRILSPQKIHSNIVKAKSKLSPLKALSIPRLELRGAVLGARLNNKRKPLVFLDEFENCDQLAGVGLSETQALYRVREICYRVREILDISEETEWKWTSTKQSIADEATRDNIVCKWS
ncbi:hypothetical protein JTB14_003830 [Gonioctena quinquepunctata]|nr:hypothetical protein JTB14_003830 [Gonioctena quinquepunctata]